MAWHSRRLIANAKNNQISFTVQKMFVEDKNKIYLNIRGFIFWRKEFDTSIN